MPGHSAGGTDVPGFNFDHSDVLLLSEKGQLRFHGLGECLTGACKSPWSTSGRRGPPLRGANYRPFQRASAPRTSVDGVDQVDRIQFIRQANRATSTVVRSHGYGRGMPLLYEYVSVPHEDGVGP